MSGKIDTLFTVISVLGLTSAITDLWKGKVYNWATFSCLIFGLYYNWINNGPAGLYSSIGAVVLSFLLYGWMYQIGTMGAGDVKLLMAFGALGGWSYGLFVGVLAVLIGGGFALVQLVWRRRLSSVFDKLKLIIFSLRYRELDIPYPMTDRKLTLPYAVPLAIAAVWVYLDNPLLRWVGDL